MPQKSQNQLAKNCHPLAPKFFFLRGGTPKKWILFIKKSVFILTCLNLVIFKVLSIWCNTPIEMFFPLLKTGFWTPQFWCLLVCLLFFVSPLPGRQNVSLWGLFSSSEKYIYIFCLGQDWVNREGGARGSCCFLNKKCWTLSSIGRCACKSTIMKWENTLRESSKNFTKAKYSLSQHHQLAHWYRWVPRTLT